VLGIVRLAEADVASILAYLNAKVEREDTKVGHVECHLHLCLESLNLHFLYASDKEIVDIDIDE
jgi:hypothetical protein